MRYKSRNDRNFYGGQAPTAKENNTNYTLFQTALLALPKFDLKASDAAEKLTIHVRNFFDICTEYGIRAGQANFALSLHISRQMFQSLLSGRSKCSPEVFEILHDVNNALGASLEDGMLSGDNNVVGSIFIAKNNFGYRDQTEQIIVHQHQGLTKEELKAIADTLPDVIDVDYEDVTDRKEIEDKNEPK